MWWDVEVSDEFKEWYEALCETEQDSIIAVVTLLEEQGPSLGRPHVDSIQDSKYPNMKELRVQHEGRPYRILFAFDPKRNAYLILGGDKTGNNRWYVEAIRRADAIYGRHMEEMGE